MEDSCYFLYLLLLIYLSYFTHQQLAPSVGNSEQKVMAPSRKVVSTAEISEDHSVQKQMTKMLAMVETSAQQVLTENRALEQARAKFTAKIAELQQENYYLKETQKKMQYNPCNLEIEENELDDEVMKPPKQKTPVAKPVENPHHVEGMT